MKKYENSNIEDEKNVLSAQINILQTRLNEICSSSPEDVLDLNSK
jgi:hypothetical protein